jgi:thiamine monophosphate kinase
LIESTDGSRRWGTVGVSANVVEASWQALLDSVEFKLHKDRLKPRKPVATAATNATANGIAMQDRSSGLRQSLDEMTASNERRKASKTPKVRSQIGSTR